MVKDVSLFSSLSGAPKQNNYVADDYSLKVTRNKDVECQHGRISNIYDVPSLSVNLMSVAQLTQTGKNVEFWSNHFIIKDMRHGGVSIATGYLDPKYMLYRFCDSPRHDSGLTPLVSQTDDRSRIWHK